MWLLFCTLLIGSFLYVPGNVSFIIHTTPEIYLILVYKPIYIILSLSPPSFLASTES
jgi:hypothetical protein